MAPAHDRGDGGVTGGGIDVDVDVDAALEAAVARLLYREAACLDDRRWDDWLALYAEEATFVVRTRDDQPDRQHVYFSLPAGVNPPPAAYRVGGRSADPPANDIRHFADLRSFLSSDGMLSGYVVLPGQERPDGHGAYRAVHGDPTALEDCPLDLLSHMTPPERIEAPEGRRGASLRDLMTGAAPSDSGSPAEGGPLEEGNRNNALFRAGCGTRARSRDDVLAYLIGVNALRCRPPHPLHEVERVADRVWNGYLSREQESAAAPVQQEAPPREEPVQQAPAAAFGGPPTDTPEGCAEAIAEVADVFRALPVGKEFVDWRDGGMCELLAVGNRADSRMVLTVERRVRDRQGKPFELPRRRDRRQAIYHEIGRANERRRADLSDEGLSMIDAAILSLLPEPVPAKQVLMASKILHTTQSAGQAGADDARVKRRLHAFGWRANENARRQYQVWVRASGQNDTAGERPDGTRANLRGVDGAGGYWQGRQGQTRLRCWMPPDGWRRRVAAFDRGAEEIPV